MIREARVLAAIPARAGSKGLPGKNVRDFCGRPLLAWSVEQARACPYVDDVIVSTDSAAVASIARASGAEVPFLRPAHLATDTASSVDALLHLIDTLEAGARRFEYLVVVEPTSPLRDVSDIAGALERLEGDPGIDSVVSVAKAESGHPAFLMRLEGMLLRPLTGNSPGGVRRQDLAEDVYYLEGSVYATSIDALRRARTFYHERTAAWVVDRYKAIEIDSLADFIAAEALMSAKLQGTIG